MSVLYLFRHGQAGTRENYDSLSDLGRQQARALGEDLARQGIRFDRVIAGGLQRQQETAREACTALGSPTIETDVGWNEFDLANVYAEMSPHLCAADAEFKRQFDEMQLAIAASRGEHQDPIHRRWNDCDRSVVMAWVEGRYPVAEGETWLAFEDRIHDALARLTAAMPEEGNVAVFSSATPIGICAAQTFGLRDGRGLQFAAVMHNAAVTTLRVRSLRGGSKEIRLFAFNGVGHLGDPRLRTFR